MMIMLLYCRSDFLTKTIVSFPLNKLLVVRVMFKNNKAGQRNRNSFSHYVRYISRGGNIWTALCCWGRLRKKTSTADLYSGIRIAYNIGFTREFAHNKNSNAESKWKDTEEDSDLDVSYLLI